MNKPIENENILKKFRYENNEFSNIVFYSIFLIVFLVLILFYLLFQVKFKGNNSSSKSIQKSVADIFIIIFFAILVVVICVSLLPNFKELKELFNQISNITYVIIYTIFLILLFTLTPKNIQNDYAYIFIPITIFIGILCFYNGFKQSFVEDFNVNYERIKMMIMFFCLITIYIVYYNTDPGGYIKKTFGYSLLLTIILSVFIFLYLIIILTLPEIQKTPSSSDKTSNFFENFNPFLLYNSISFIIFIVIITISITTYPGGFFNDIATSSGSLILILLIFILWSILLGANLFSDVSNKNVISTDLNLIKRSFLVLFWFIIIGLIVYWLVYSIGNLTTNYGIFKFILNLSLLLLLFGLIYKTMIVNLPVGNSKKNAFFMLIINMFLYIPCLVNEWSTSFGKFVSGQYNSNESVSFIILFVSLLLLILYFIIPKMYKKLYLQGGKQLINKPVDIDSQHNLGNYIDLNNGDEVFDYKYALSFWLYIDSSPPNSNSNYNKFTSVLNFGNKPNILYNAEKNTLMITMDQKDLQNSTNNKLIDFDENGNRIIYINNSFLLQKWNNIIVNYNGGTMDIFLNGELVKSSIEVVPYYTYDNLTIGENNGIKGGMCNVIYFRNALTSSQIFFLYNIVKNKTPPIVDDNNDIVVK